MVSRGGGGGGGGDDVLFALPIESSGGKFEVTQPATKVYLLTFTSPPDNRLTSSFCQTFVAALDIIEHRLEPGVVVTTSGIAKFYSNGLDIEHAHYTPGFWTDSLYPLWRRLITFPMPTVALVNGHAFAGGLMVAMMHDYRIMNPHKGWLCLPEVEMGAELSPAMVAIFRQKIGPATLRRLLLEAHRYKALEALKEGIVDWVGGLDETLAHIEEFKLVQKAQPGTTGRSVYAQLKSEMWRETLAFLNDRSREDLHRDQAGLKAVRERTLREVWVKEWEGRKARL